ncbi:cyclic-phosphate processing receiver domain-containing protein [Domibacillus sp.]|uniref:cyclic-phosphate processing receiver domain-containing protein n=1 Tax=Domibacillus sp. TaxID=1969783 RepID=UPI0028120282|nr:cyclic-phosphate processing receiver domain-containing protein [Domibacillus sp.]
MMSINVFLDDYRTCPPDHTLVETIDECFDLLKNHAIGHLSLDHDLVSKSRNGFVLVQLMVEHQLFAERITIHSANSTGGKAMYRFLKEAQSSHQMPRSIQVTLRPLPLHPPIDAYKKNRNGL